MKKVMLIAIGLMWTASAYAGCPCCDHKADKSAEQETAEMEGVAGEVKAVE